VGVEPGGTSPVYNVHTRCREEGRSSSVLFFVTTVTMTAGIANVHVVMQEPTEESPAAPDSTTKERSGFSEGEDVLLEHKDGRYYLGTIVEVRTEPTVVLIHEQLLFGTFPSS
jgi:hypothetical protein